MDPRDLRTTVTVAAGFILFSVPFFDMLWWPTIGTVLQFCWLYGAAAVFWFAVHFAYAPAGAAWRIPTVNAATVFFAMACLQGPMSTPEGTLLGWLSIVAIVLLQLAYGRMLRLQEATVEDGSRELSSR